MGQPGQHNARRPFIKEGKIEEVSFPLPLFLRPEFVYRNPSKTVRSFLFQDQQPTALVHFMPDDAQRYLSLPHAPFGSFWANADCSGAALEDFVASVKAQFVDEGVKELRVRHFPASYHPQLHDRVLKALLAQEFEIIYTETNQFIPLQGRLQEHLFDHSKLHLVKKCREAGFSVTVSPDFDAEEWYRLLVEARIQRGHPLTIGKEELTTIHRLFPECYRFFEVRDKSRLVACAIGVRAYDDVLYYYLAASDARYQAFSPMSLLLHEMYAWALEQQIKVLDMGISSVNGILNEGLHWFKKSFGAQDEPKHVLQWTAKERKSNG